MDFSESEAPPQQINDQKSRPRKSHSNPCHPPSTAPPPTPFPILRYATHLRTSLLFPHPIVRVRTSWLMYRLRLRSIERAAQCRASRLRRGYDNLARELPSSCPPSRKNCPSHASPLSVCGWEGMTERQVNVEYEKCIIRL